MRFTIFPSMSAPSTLQPKIIFWVLACSRQPSKAGAIERLGRNPCRIKGAGVEPTPERPVIGVEAVLALADAVPERYRALVLLATFGSLRWGS